MPNFFPYYLALVIYSYEALLRSVFSGLFYKAQISTQLDFRLIVIKLVQHLGFGLGTILAFGVNMVQGLIQRVNLLSLFVTNTISVLFSNT